MDLRQLEAFAAVMTTGSVTAAGRMLDRSQPAVTRLIQDLEEVIGYPLFVRSGPRVKPTEKAFLLYEYVEQALISLKQIRTRAEEIGKDEDRPLSISATPALAAGLLPKAIAQADLHRSIQIRSESAEQTVHAVVTGTAELGISSLPLEHAGLKIHWIGQAACVAAVRSDDALASKEKISLKDFQGRRIITMHNPFRLRHFFDEALRGASVTAESVIETNSSLNVLTAIRANLGIALMEPISAYGVALEGIAIRRIDAEIPFKFGVISLSSRPLPASTQKLIQTLQDCARIMLPDFCESSRGADKD